MSSLYQLFKELLPKPAQLVAVVQAEFPDGTTSCLTLDNQLIRVKGVGGRALGDHVFVVSDPTIGLYILGSAPQLPSFSVEIY